ncbi:unnamed protein product [Rotaria magnacalcarata]|uniref:VCBS repeat-containing protein n=1 Tax=Rotaria magnacalcarata TaxID=392030 RepID=A0A819TJ37_9BILA|nr:unnamed protein product [Rotaria magnacalcarata]CAF4080060.1 unnamed protein product [Rotaria magnacalcarata]
MYKPILNQKPQYNSLTNSIAAADFNEDGFLDMVVTNYGSHNIGILLGKGDGTFQNQITYSTGIFSHPYFVLVNGFNGDMRKDIVVANYGSNSLELFFGIGNGFFTSQVPFAVDNCRPVLIAVGDFNNDSLLDIAAANYDTNNIGIFLGYGNGSFQNQTVYTTELGSRSHSIAVGDFNRNSRLDLAVVNSGKDSMAIFYGNGHGTFANQKPNSGSDNLGVFVYNEKGDFASINIYSTGYGSTPQFVIVGNFNNDHRMNIAVANNDSNSVGILMSDRTIAFKEQIVYSTGSDSQPSSVTVGYFNNDNKKDVVVTNN